MSRHIVRLPDVGEGIAEAELIEWHVQVGDRVTAESTLAEVMTDKATVEISSPVEGTVASLHGEPGEMLAVGSDFVIIDLDGQPAETGDPPPSPPPPPPPVPTPPAAPADIDEPPPHPAPAGGRATASPAVRQRARTLDIDLTEIVGSGPGGRVLHTDLDRHLLTGAGAGRAETGIGEAATVEHVRGLRRQIARRLTATWREIPHITYVEELDVTDLEVLRDELNDRATGTKLTLLAFVVRAIVLACRDQPRLNAHYDGQAETLTTFDAVHVGIATQTPSGLVVPVVRHAESATIRELADEIARLAAAARDGDAQRAELSGSTISVTSLGALGGVVTTPLLNAPEVAIIGVNKMQVRPTWRDGGVAPRTMVNLSSSFDHRVVDGWDAATFVQRLKSLLEVPALLFVDQDG